jgi:multiple sugar transport system ATP-binding protein
MAEITLESLTKVYSDGTKAVTGLELEVAAGEFVVFVGPSGCGKTTALRMIAGLESITSGHVRIDGRIVNDLPPKDRDIAMVFQNYALYPHMDAAKNMGFALKMRGIPKDEIDRRVKEAARILGLTDALGKKPRTLSGGQRQRVAMGRAIVRNPQAFLMDEPLSNLDAKLRVEMRAEISRIQRDLGVTTVYVTHDQTEAMTMGDRVVVMRSGFLQQIAAPKVLYERPRNLFVAEFIGSPAMNLVAATVASADDKLWVSFGPHRLQLEPETIANHPGLDGYSGREVVLGIRPEDMEDAAVVPAPRPHRRISVVCDIREDLGSEVYAPFRVAADAVTKQ